MRTYEIEAKAVVPLRVEVTHYAPAVPGRYSGEPDDCYPDEPAELEWEAYGPDGELAEIDEAEADRITAIVLRLIEKGE